MDGLLIIDKPAGITSHDVVARVRRILKTKRVGHTGTLDPFATGVLVLLVGAATRLAQFVDKDEKEYEATIQFGFETDTGDVTGTRSAECGLRTEEVADALLAVKWNDVLSKFRGDIMQTPPMYSAKKVQGKKLYELARKGVEIDRKPVKVRVSELEIMSDEVLDPRSSIRIIVACSAGTYIRTLAEDIGRTIGVGAHLTELRRTRAGRFRIDEAITLPELEDFQEPQCRLIPMEEAVSHLPAIVLSGDRIAKTRNGLSTRVEAEQFADGASVRMIDDDSQLIAIGVARNNENIVQPKIVLG